MFHELKNSKKVIGTKQVKKAVQNSIAQKVYLADDAEPHIIGPLKELCHQYAVEVEMIDSMKTLGEACGIEVGSAAVALLYD
ncbi:MAG: ribosomal L7Ae/L30e/S12e/Gadd45 family protein [Bacillota bacterium]|nr:ribosomal L7Ae/L30e/S12e/Gadd45 family protein [Bacillota bacterium]